jgi:lysyl endopeptidase
MSMNKTATCQASSCAAAQPSMTAEHESRRAIRTVRKTPLYAVLAATLFVMPLAHAASSVAKMGDAVVTEAPMAESMGGALFATRDLRGPMLVDLGLPSVADARALKQRREDHAKRGQPLEIGFPRNVPNARIVLSKLGWQRLADGSLATRFEVSSDTAVAMRAALSLKAIGRGNVGAVTLRFGGADGRVFEQSGREFAGRNTGWSPVLMGDTATVEIVLAKGQRPQNFALSLPQISHFDTSPIASEADLRAIAKIGESEKCHRDIICRSNPNAKFLRAEKAVARMTFVRSGSSYLCTGTLLNNNHVPKKWMFWSAAHCISTQTVADTLQTFWFYKASTCGGASQSAGAVTVSGGAFLRHVNVTRDTLLLELKKAPPTGATYASWSNSDGGIGHDVESIHHPKGDVKKYSLGAVEAMNVTFEGKSPLFEVNWYAGTTQGGSSGGGLFMYDSDGDYVLIGGLYGGEASCATPGRADYYSVLGGVWNSIKSYLIK